MVIIFASLLSFIYKPFNDKITMNPMITSSFVVADAIFEVVLLVLLFNA